MRFSIKFKHTSVLILLGLFSTFSYGNSSDFNKQYKKVIHLLGTDLEAADSISKDLLKKARAQYHDSLLSKAYFLNGITNYHQDQPALSNYYYRKAIQTPYAMAHSQFMAKVWNNMGTNHEMMGQYDSAYHYYKQSLAVKKQSGDTLAVANMWLNLSGHATKLGNYDKCESLLTKALPYLKHYKDSQSVASAYQTMAFNQAQQGNSEQAIPYYKKALAVYEKLGDKNGMAQNFGNLAYRYHDLGEYNKALSYLDSLSNLLQHYHKPSIYFKEKLSRAENLLMLKRTDEAGAILKSLVAKKQAMAKQGMLQHFYLAWMGWQASLGHMEEFQKTRETYRKRQDSLRKAMLRQKTNELKVLHNLDKKNDLLEQKDQLITLKSNQNFWLTIALVLVVGLLLIVSVLYFKNYQLRQVITQLNLASFLNLKPIQTSPEGIPSNPQNSQKGNGLSHVFTHTENLVKEEEWYRYSNLTVKMLAKEIGTNQLYISRAINHYSALNFNNYLDHYRIHIAKKLLLERSNEENAITNIGYEVGFANPSTFSRTFKKLTGLTPSGFLQINKQ